ncbi:MAG: hypothetical protein K6A28_00860 [Bacteroidales bacterium]|nr:hypothetical protein [Bacteroidales bacterium]
MKKIIAIVALLMGVLSFSSCEKSQEHEWGRFYGYTKADIIGQYEAIVGDEYYPELPTGGIEIYRDVTVEIIEQGENQNLVRFHIVIPDVLNKTFTGVVNPSENDSELAFNNSAYHEDALMTVYKNEESQVRLQGRVRRVSYNGEGEVVNSIVYGFDVVKAE